MPYTATQRVRGRRLGLRQRRANTSAARRDFGQNDGAEQKKGALAVFNVLAFSPSLACRSVYALQEPKREGHASSAGSSFDWLNV
ncbi:MAG: hypothetical protein WBX22_23665 [Silvibacterium sp.]